MTQYSPARMAALFSDRARLGRWWQVEVAALDAHETLGHAPPGTGAGARACVPAIDRQLMQEVAERRGTTGHDVAAFVDVIAARLGRHAPWFHFGLTSADVIDTANGLLLVKAIDLLDDGLRGLERLLADQVRQYASTPIMGRTHGMFAEPTTLGAKIAVWASRVGRDRDRLAGARRVIAVGNLSGPVGTYANVDPAVEELACAALGLARVVNAQFVSRDRYADYLWACACIATTVEALCTQIRLLHTSEVGEVQEEFHDGQKGSSSMPHKKNPSASMELVGLSRVLRGYLVSTMESTAAWQEGDTTALAVERVVLPDASCLALFMVERMSALVEGLIIDEAAMRAKFDDAQGLPFSSALLHVLVEAGVERDVAYRAMQATAHVARSEGIRLDEAFRREAPVALPDEQLEEAMSLERALRYVHAVTGVAKNVGH